MKLFLIAGKAGSGKNEVASIIKDYYDADAIITSFSKYIKLFALELTSWDGRDISKPREFLQNMGDKLRACDEDFLTKRIEEDLLIYKSNNINNVIISDVRLIHEIEYFKNIKMVDVVTIRVNCDKCKRDLTLSEKNHHTELELDNYDKFDYVIKNNYDEKLKKDVIEILEGMK